MIVKKVKDLNDPRKWNFKPLDLLDFSKSRFVECDVCKTKHSMSSEDFMVYYGNVTVGIGGGLIGNNLHHGAVMRVAVMCRKPECHKTLLKYILEDEDVQDNT